MGETAAKLMRRRVSVALAMLIPLARGQGCGVGDVACPCVSSFDGFNVSNLDSTGVPRCSADHTAAHHPKATPKPSQVPRERLQPTTRA